VSEAEIPIVTVPGPTVSARVSPDQMVAYLLAHGWVEDVGGDPFRQFWKGDDWASVPVHMEWSDYARRVAESITWLATIEDRPEHVILAEIAGESMPADAVLKSLLDLLGSIIDGIEHRPGMYAQHPEALEAMFGHAVEFRQRILRPRAHEKDGHETFDALLRYAARVAKREWNTSLYLLLREQGRLDDLPKVLGDCGRWVATKYPPEAP
jgi:hypothetical protein